MRFDKLLTLYFFGPIVRKARSGRGIRIPILMYHSISDEPESGHPYYWINTSPKVFAEHMEFLHENEYSVINLYDAVKLAKSFSDHPISPSLYYSSKYVVLTFDDGYRDFYTHAFYILKKFGFSATVFLPTGFIDSERKPGLKEKEHLSWEEVEDLRKEDIIFGSHTVNHPQLSLLRKNEIEYEVKKSKELIEDKIMKPVDSFSYPCAFPQEDGEFKKYITNILEGFGYKQGVTTIIGRSGKEDNWFLLKRIPVNSDDNLGLFKAKLEGGYDWLSNPQHFYRRLNKILNRRSELNQ